MFKVYLVDDEKPIIDELLSIIDWEKINCEICGYNTDSVVALQEITDLEPDILISDINMYGINGLELVSRVTKTRKDLGVILLTAYDLFDYVAEAIKLRVLSYLVKPVNKKELCSVIENFQKVCANTLFYDFFKMIENGVANEKTIKRVETESVRKGIIQKGKRYGFALIGLDEELNGIVAEYKGDDFRFALLNLDEIEEGVLTNLGVVPFVGGEGLLRYAKTTFDTKGCAVIDKEQKEIKIVIDKIIEDIEKNYNKKISLGYYAEEYHYNLTYLSQQFKLYKGMNFIDYLIKVKMDKAKAFMRDKSLNMTAIAYRLGYGDYSHFSKIFKKYEGISPADYRKNYC